MFRLCLFYCLKLLALPLFNNLGIMSLAWERKEGLFLLLLLFMFRPLEGISVLESRLTCVSEAGDLVIAKILNKPISLYGIHTYTQH